MATGGESEILKLFESISENEKYSHTAKGNVIIFLGCTGDGKSTLTQFLAEDPGLRSEGQYGQYTITDDTGRIGAAGATIHSKTIQPNLVPYGGPDNPAFIMDCPGFHDTRSSSTDVVCTILTKKALSFCPKVKLILVINEFGVRKGGSRNAFVELVKHTFEFVKNFEKFKDSVALFVTKVMRVVDEDKDGNFHSQPDEHFVMRIREFLEDTRKTIQEQENVSNEKQTDYANVLTLISLLLQDTKESHGIPRICIFRCPSKKGYLRDMPDFKKCQSTMNNMIRNILQFTQVKEADFGYSLSAESKVEINNAVEDIIKKAILPVKSIMKRIENGYDSIEGKEGSEQLCQIFEKHFGIWTVTLEKLQSSNVTCDFFKCLLDHIQFCRRTFSGETSTGNHKFEQDIVQFEKYIELLQLLQTVSNMDFQITTNELLRPFEEASDIVSNAHIWYGAMKTMFSYFSAYDFQNISDSVEVSAFMSTLEMWKSKKGTAVTADDFNDEFRKICGKDLGYQIDFPISYPKVEHLYHLCKFVFTEKQVRVIGNGKRVEGRYLLLSKILSDMANDIGELEIFASHRIFIDCDFLAIGKKMQIFIAAPEWEVIGERRKIVLDGGPGPVHPVAARKGRKPGGRGEDGMPGNPGTSGGHFLGAGIDFKNVSNLEVTACGGRGGNGQDGGEGRKGSDGADATLSEDIFKASADACVKENNSHFYIVFNSDNTKVELKIPGEEGERGGNGGNGGCGGIGGYPGEVLFIGCGSCDQPRMISNKGDNGQSGKGGRGGLGGKQGRTLEGNAERNIDNFALLVWSTKIIQDTKQIESQVVAETGLEGKSNGSGSCPAKPLLCEYKNFVQSLSDYIGWLSRADNSVPENPRYLEHLRKICTFKQDTNIQSLATELIQIESCMLRQGDLTACRDKYVLLKLHILYFTSTTSKFKEGDLKILCFFYVIILFRLASDFRKIPQLEAKGHLVSKAIQKITGAKCESKHSDTEKPAPAHTASIHNDIWLKLDNYDALESEIDRLAGVSVATHEKKLITEQVLNFKDLMNEKLHKKSKLKAFYEKIAG